MKRQRRARNLVHKSFTYAFAGYPSSADQKEATIKQELNEQPYAASSSTTRTVPRALDGAEGVGESENMAKQEAQACFYAGSSTCEYTPDANDEDERRHISVYPSQSARATLRATKLAAGLDSPPEPASASSR